MLQSLKEEKLGLNGSDVSASLFSTKIFLLAKAQLAGVVGSDPGKHDREELEMTKGGS